MVAGRAVGLDRSSGAQDLGWCWLLAQADRDESCAPERWLDFKSKPTADYHGLGWAAQRRANLLISLRHLVLAQPISKSQKPIRALS